MPTGKVTVIERYRAQSPAKRQTWRLKKWSQGEDELRVGVLNDVSHLPHPTHVATTDGDVDVYENGDGTVTLTKGDTLPKPSVVVVKW